MKQSIYWFKRDLRILDNTALNTCLNKNDRVSLIYIFEPSLISNKYYHARHWKFVEESLIDLKKQLAKINLQLHILYGESLEIFKFISANFQFSSIYSTQETGISITYARDKSLAKFFKTRNVNWFEFQNNGVIRGIKDRETWVDTWYNYMQEPLSTINHSIARSIDVDFKHYNYTLKFSKEMHNFSSQNGGETEALKRVDEFANHSIVNYSKHISKPVESRISCSRLSPYFAWGNLSIRYSYQHIKNNKAHKGRAYANAFLQRLRWHCHFIQKFEMEDRMETENVNRGYDSIRNEVDLEKLDLYKSGRTGFPLVDACIRCLEATGYINFRMRAMLVSFATHHLWLPWQSISDFLSQRFLDFEPGIHFPQLQMQAGVTGTNTIRIYNPIKQSKDHDPEGKFIKYWIPELSDCPTEYIHEPWSIPSTIFKSGSVDITKQYPYPVVDINKSYRYAREKLWGVRSRTKTKQESERILKMHTIPRHK